MAHAAELGESDEFALGDPPPGRRLACVRARGGRRARAAPDSRSSAPASRSAAGCRSAPACPPRPRSRSRCAWRWPISDRAPCPRGRRSSSESRSPGCARVSRTTGWAPRPGLLDQLASLYGAPDTALCIDFSTLEIEPVPLRLDGWRLVLLDSGERHVHASSGYNERRAECARGLPAARRGVAARGDRRGERAAARTAAPARRARAR